MTSLTSVPMEIATSFLGLAKTLSSPLSSINTTLFFCRNRPKIVAQARKFLACTASSNSRIVYSSKQLGKRFSGRFTASSATTSAPEAEDSDVLTKIPPDNRIPATIITGFLGSGKTTLLNHILTADHGKRIAVIENEYGEVDIDGSLVAAKAAGVEDIIMLNNGCLCCTVRGDLVRMISELVRKKKGKFDHIVIETTGLANPAPIIQTFYAEDQIFNDVKLDGVVTLVDAKHAGIHLDEVKPKGVINEAVEQIAYADRIIVNKTDLVREPEVASLVERIRSVNRMAQLKRTQYGKVDLDYVLGIGGFDLERIDSAVEAGQTEQDHHDHGHEHDHHHHDHEHDHDHEHHDHHSHDHSHDPGVSSVSIVCEGTLDLEKANMWLGNLLLERSEDIYRMKGLLSVDGMNERFVFQSGVLLSDINVFLSPLVTDQIFPFGDLKKASEYEETKDADENESDDDEDVDDDDDDDDDNDDEDDSSEEGGDDDDDGGSDDDAEANGDGGSDDDDDDDDDEEDDDDDEDDDDSDSDEEEEKPPSKKKK